MRLINADALKAELIALIDAYPNSYKAIRTAIAIVDRSPVIEGEELEALVDGADYDWLLEQEY